MSTLPSGEGKRETKGRQRQPTFVKLSFGIVVCRINPKTRRPEVALVRKRYTYAFHEFVHQRLSAKNEKTIAALLEKMTPEELNDVRSLNFGQMWYRVWLINDTNDLYDRKFARFSSNFINNDGGKRLLRIANSVRATGTLIWEPPGGQKEAGESDIACAIREFEQETNIGKAKYRIIPDVRRRSSFKDMGVKYVKVYHVAVANSWLGSNDTLERTFQSRDVTRSAECGEIGWFDIEQIRLIDHSRRLEELISPLFRLVKRAVQGKRIAPKNEFVLSNVFGRVDGGNQKEVTETASDDTESRSESSSEDDAPNDTPRS